MDIYSFINSPDIAEHCRKINHTWSPFDMAVIIGISTRPMADRHAAWRELITVYPDMPTPEGLHHPSYPSLHEKIREAMAYEEVHDDIALALLKKAEPGAVYISGVDTYNGNYSNYAYGTFSTFELAFASAIEPYDPEEIQSVHIRKSFTDDCENDKGAVSAKFDYNGNLQRISLHAYDDLLSKWFQGLNNDSIRIFTDDFYVIIPTPFKRGDILTFDTTTFYFGEKIFVMDYLDESLPHKIERRKQYDGDRSDMNAWAYCIDEDGAVYDDHIYCYDRIQYYRGKLEGKDSLLQYLSWYLKDEISLTAFVQMQNKSVLKCLIENKFDDTGWMFPKEHVIANEDVLHKTENTDEPELSIIQISFLAREMNMTDESVTELKKKERETMSTMINKAVMFATMAHENQNRKGTDIPYILHPMEAAVIVSQIKHDSDLICAALLHDVAEDSYMSYDSLAAMFSKRIADLVFFQSEDKSKSWKERKQHTLSQLANLKDEDTKIVCLADKLSNIRAVSRDYDAIGDKLWERFNVSDKNEQGWYYKGICSGLASLAEYPAYQEFKTLVDKVFG